MVRIAYELAPFLCEQEDQVSNLQLWLQRQRISLDVIFVLFNCLDKELEKGLANQ